MIGYLKKLYHFSLAWLGNIFYRSPSKKLFVVGVTGTKGKSTVIELINAILEEAGQKTALMSSVRTKIDEQSQKNLSGMSMPGRFAIQRFLRRAVNSDCQFALLEVTSQGIEQYRHRFIAFDAALVTNLHPEHIESHGGFEKYRDAKVRFFADMRHSGKNQKYFFINSAMAEKEHFEKAVIGRGNVFYFDREDFISGDLSRHYRLDSSEAKKMISGWLQNDFNLENVAVAVAFAKSQDIPHDMIFRALENFKGVSGRIEYVRREPFAVIIDYAHTPDSLEAVYKAASDSGKHPLICVLGSAGGGRDRWKRPKMGEIAGRFCKEIILTSEDPYDESPEDIADEMARGIFGAKSETQYEKILDRRSAIAKAIAIARPLDAVVLTGKGSESFMHIAGGKKMPWNEKAVVEEILNQK